MAITLKALAIQTSGNQTTVYLSATPSGSYVVGGDTVDFTSIQNPNNLPKPSPSRLFQVPPSIYLEEMSGVYTGMLDGTTLANYKLKFYTGGGSEFSAATYASQGVTLANFNVAQTTGMKLIIAITFPTGT